MLAEIGDDKCPSASNTRAYGGTESNGDLSDEPAELANTTIF